MSSYLTQQPIKILVIDDEDALRNGVKRLLQSEGYIVDTAENGLDGIKLGLEKEYDIALIDMKMPDIDGIEVMTQLRKAKPNLICFIVTAFASYDTAILSIKKGADGYIPKPFTPDELLNNLIVGCEKRKLLLEAELLRKEREEKLLEVAFERTRLNTIINSLADGVVVINREKVIVLFNPAAVTLLKLESLKIECSMIECLPAEIKQLVNRYFEEPNLLSSLSTQFRLDENQDHYLEVTASPIYQSVEKFSGVAVVVKDISQLKRLEALKSQFVSMVAHELKAPVAATIGYLNLLLNGSIQIPEDKKLEYLRRSELRLNSLLMMVNDLLDISKMDAKKTIREIKNISLVPLIKDVIKLFEIELESKELSLSTHFLDDNIIVKGDLNELQRVFTNILSNAIKYNKVKGEVEITIETRGNFAVIQFRDTGIGLKPAEKEKLFQEFFRASNEYTKKVHGTGLGMSIVKRIIDSYAGKIEVESTFGVGSTFKIFLPLSS